MATVSFIFFCAYSNQPHQPHSQVQNSKEYLISSEASQAKFNSNTRILIQQPFLHWAHATHVWRISIKMVHKQITNRGPICTQATLWWIFSNRNVLNCAPTTNKNLWCQHKVNIKVGKKYSVLQASITAGSHQIRSTCEFHQMTEGQEQGNMGIDPIRSKPGSINSRVLYIYVCCSNRTEELTLSLQAQATAPAAISRMKMIASNIAN